MENLTAYRDTAAFLKNHLRDAKVDEKAFRKPISLCDLSRCHGTCCHDGVYLNGDEASLIPKLASNHATKFQSYGLNLPERPVVYGKTASTSGPKTATKPVAMSDLVADYPSHFADTNCVFLCADGRCGLQRLSEDLGKPPWYYKPFTCWLHPVAIVREGQTTRITLHDRESDPQNTPDYPGFASLTGCGQEAICGKPAREVLDRELTMLGKIADRDFSLG